ncbi:inositol-3-phosphate synthase [Hymenobacter psoromatis]|nr:inositol-3-phosphate synthase [Hymenobacter psoromatis]
MKEQKGLVAPADGKLGILLPGMGAVATTLIAGVLAVRKGTAQPIGSLTQMGKIRTSTGNPVIKDFAPLTALADIEFGGWDVYEDNVYEAALKAGVLDYRTLQPVRAEMEALVPMKAAFDPRYVKNLDGTHVKTYTTKLDLAEQVIADIRNFKATRDCSRLVMVWCGSTEIYHELTDTHRTLANFEAGLRANAPHIAPSMIYAYAALREGVPFVNGAPNLTVDVPALLELAATTGTPVAGKDFKTGQTLMKTIVAPGLSARSLGVRGWFSTNILGNRDGLVLDDPDNFRTKEVSKLSVLDSVFHPQENPELYGDMYHKVRINYYPPAGDNKESWDNIDIFGWLGYPMQIKINFLCRDSILAAPLVLDLALFMDLAKRAGLAGVQEWLSFYLKSPQTAPGLRPEHDIFKQLVTLHNTLRLLMGEEPVAAASEEAYQDGPAM